MIVGGLDGARDGYDGVCAECRRRGEDDERGGVLALGVRIT